MMEQGKAFARTLAREAHTNLGDSPPPRQTHLTTWRYRPSKTSESSPSTGSCMLLRAAPKRPLCGYTMTTKQLLRMVHIRATQKVCRRDHARGARATLSPFIQCTPRLQVYARAGGCGACVSESERCRRAELLRVKYTVHIERE